MSGTSAPLWGAGNWWNGGNPGGGGPQGGMPGGMGGPPQSPLMGYAERLRAAGGMGAQPGVSPLAAAYTPPVYQGTPPPHVDVNAVIAAMNGEKPAEMPGQGVVDPIGATPGMNAEPQTNPGAFDNPNGGWADMGRALGTGLGVVGGIATGGIAGPLALGSLGYGAATGTAPSTMGMLGAGAKGVLNSAKDLMGFGGGGGMSAADFGDVAAGNAHGSPASDEGGPGNRGGDTDYRNGGYTGNVPRDQVAGVVHGQEEVINAPATAAVGRKGLAALNKGDPEAISLAKKITTSVGKRNDNRGGRGDAKAADKED